MRNELNQIEYIENYLAGKLTASEQLLFENRLASDENLRYNTELQQQITNRISVNAFKAEIASFHTTFTGKLNTKSLSLKSIWLNSLLGVILVGTISASLYYLADKNEAVQTNNIVSIINDNNQESVENILTSNNIVSESNSQYSYNKKKGFIINTVVDSAEKNTPNIKPIIEIPKYESICKSFIQPFNSQMIDAQKGGDVKTNDSKSTIHFDANNLVDENGNSVTGMVEIRYREYRNSAQTAFSKIPMHYIENSEETNMNSAGMFEVRAYQNNKEVYLKPGKSFTVDYNATNKMKDCFFFALDDKSKEWKKLKPIEFGKDTNNRVFVNDYDLPDLKLQKDIYPDQGRLLIKVKNYSGEVLKDVTIKDIKTKSDNFKDVAYKDLQSDAGYKVLILAPGKHDILISQSGYKKLRLKNITIKNGKITKVNAELALKQGYHFVRATKVGGSYVVVDTCQDVLKDVITAKGKKSKRDRPNGALIVDNGNRKDGTLLAEDMNAGHTYPTLVKGLQCASFGVYNCDQINRVEDRLAIKANYLDSDGNQITNSHVLSMIDLKYNGAFSFDPKQFTCSKSGRNVLLLFTNDKKLYVLSEEEYQKMKVEQSGEYNFTMSNITEKVRDSEELRKYLGLK